MIRCKERLVCPDIASKSINFMRAKLFVAQRAGFDIFFLSHALRNTLVDFEEKAYTF
jgi:hypothetical protein